MSDENAGYPPPTAPPASWAPPDGAAVPDEQLGEQPTTSSWNAPTRARLNPLAVLSMITGILLLGPAAVVLGHVGLAQTRRRGERGRGLAIAGLVLGYLGTVLLIVTWWLVSAWIAALRRDGYLPS